MRYIIIIFVGFISCSGRSVHAEDTARLRQGWVLLTGGGYYRQQSIGDFRTVQTLTIQPGVYYFCSDHLSVGVSGTYTSETFEYPYFTNRIIMLAPGLHARLYGPYDLYFGIQSRYILERTKRMNEHGSEDEIFWDYGAELGKDLFLFPRIALEPYVRYTQRIKYAPPAGQTSRAEVQWLAGVRLVVVL